MRSFTLEDDGYCFACGKENSSGLGLEFRSRDDMMVAEFTPLKQHQGFKNIVHGGIITTLLDEAMVKAVLSRGALAMTAEIAVRFRSPLRVGDRVVVEARINTFGARLIEATAVLKRANDVVAEGRAKMLLQKNI